MIRLLDSARGGETIRLAPGRYDDVAIRGQFTTPVTITSADANSRAELTAFNIRDARGIKLSNLKLTDRTPDNTNDFAVQNSSNIVLEKLLVTGSKSGTEYEQGLLIIRSSTNVTVTRSEVSNARYGISLLDNRDISITKNYFHNMRTDGVRGGGNSDIEILDNLFTNFFPVDGDHPDAIQFWTTNTTASTSDIRIADNVIVRGSGGKMQGIFMGDEASLPYRNVSIQRNTVIGTMYHGISVRNAASLNVANNRVAGMSDMKSWIYVPLAAVLKGNSAQQFVLGGSAVAALTGNTVIPMSSNNGASYAQTWLAANPR